ncbi:unnamed protein product [Penicillium manginii]
MFYPSALPDEIGLLAYIILGGAIYLLFFNLHHTSLVSPHVLPKESLCSSDILISDPELCRQLISGTMTQNSKQNQLLRTVFAIENAFTSTEDVAAVNFVRDASRRISLKPAEWSSLSHFLVDTARQWILIDSDIGDLGSRLRKSMLSEPRGRVGINITSLVQVFTLKAILRTVCKAEAQDRPDDIAILELAQQINRGWIESKSRTRTSGDDANMLCFEHNEPLQASLRAVFSQPMEGGQNPLNFVLPSFETMWRVVLRALLEIKFKSGRDHPWWGETLIAFCRDASKVQFEKREGQSIIEETPSAKDIIMETMRLYPPTRRIYRAYQWDNSLVTCEEIPDQEMNVPVQSSLDEQQSCPVRYSKIAANIEGCHLRPNIWGVSVAIFDPVRWLDLTPEQRRAFMPFGCGPHECPAKAGFGPKMIGVLVGALLLVLDNNGLEPGMSWELECPDDQVMKSLAKMERMSLERDAYDDCYLVHERCHRSWDLDPSA